MDSFLTHASEIFDAARSCVQAGGIPSDLAILIGRSGDIRIVADTDWPLESLRRERGAEMAFHVGGSGGHVAVEGRAVGRTCRLESEKPADVWRRLLNIPSPLLPALTAATR